ncbi:MAG: hypothetical protein GXP62_11510 [Oligoflexia bacterium]|nr:hypothetical protein [Oligoflexia bacterium]
MSALPSPTDLRALSALLSGDLPPQEAAGLQARLDTDPALKRAADTLRSLPDQLADLPLLDPPPGLSQAVIDSLSTPADLPAPANSQPGATQARSSLAWAVAAAAVVFAASTALWPHAPTRVDLSEGGAKVEGRAQLAVADSVLDVDGRARLSPACPSCTPADRARIAVYEGSARVSTPDGRTLNLAAGQSTDLPAMRPSASFQRVSTHSGGGVRRDSSLDRARLSADVSRELDRLERENARLEQENAMVRSSLAAKQGPPMAWPDDLPPALGADAFPSSVRQALADLPNVDLVTVDCSEYPCLAVVLTHSQDPGWEQTVLGPAQMMADGMDGELRLVGMEDADGPVTQLSFTVLPTDAGTDIDTLSARVGARANELMRAQSGSNTGTR